MILLLLFFINQNVVTIFKVSQLSGDHS